MPDLFQIAKRISDRWYFVKSNVVREKELSLSYFKYRLFRPLLKIYNKILVLSFGKNKPWLSPASIKILEESLNKKMNGLEYGSGRSTIYFSMKVKQLTCIEHHSEWFSLVSKELSNNNIGNVDYIKIPVPLEESKEDIKIRYSYDFDHENDIYREYYEKVSEYPDSSFDFILIDGRARVECSSRAITKLKSGGMFILDNSERKRYQPVHDKLSGWKKINTTTGLTDTTFWFKP